MIALFVYFYKTPELSLLKHQAATRIAEEIRTEGFEVSERMGGTSMVAITKNGTGPMVDPRKSLKKITDHACIDPIRPHDLRHTFSNIAKYEAGISEGDVGKFLNHKGTITDSYIGQHHAKQQQQLSTIEGYLDAMVIIDEKQPHERFSGVFLKFFYDNEEFFMPAGKIREERPFEDFLV